MKFNDGKPFSATPLMWGAYQHWLKTEACCEKCGARYSDRKRDENGTALDLWVTETLCGKCWTAPRNPPEA